MQGTIYTGNPATKREVLIEGEANKSIAIQSIVLFNVGSSLSQVAISRNGLKLASPIVEPGRNEPTVISYLPMYLEEGDTIEASQTVEGAVNVLINGFVTKKQVREE